MAFTNVDRRRGKFNPKNNCIVFNGESSASSIFIPDVLARLCLPDSQRPWRSVRHRATVSVRVLQKRNAKRTGGTADRRWRERHSHEARLPLCIRPDGEERRASRSQAIDGFASQARHQRHDLTTLTLSLHLSEAALVIYMCFETRGWPPERERERDRKRTPIFSRDASHLHWQQLRSEHPCTRSGK